MSINRVNISGRLTRDAEVRQTPGGLSVLSISVAVNDRRKNPTNGEWQDYPNYVDCTMFGARAESVAKFISKGSKVAIEGKLRWSAWEKDGQKRSKLEVIIDEIEFMSTQNQGNAAYANDGAQTYSMGQGQPNQYNQYNQSVPQSAQGGIPQGNPQMPNYAPQPMPAQVAPQPAVVTTQNQVAQDLGVDTSSPAYNEDEIPF